MIKALAFARAFELELVGTTRFELATPCTPCKCATGLRYVPKNSGLFLKKNLLLPKSLGEANVKHYQQQTKLNLN